MLCCTGNRDYLTRTHTVAPVSKRSICSHEINYKSQPFLGKWLANLDCFDPVPSVCLGKLFILRPHVSQELPSSVEALPSTRGVGA